MIIKKTHYLYQLLYKFCYLKSFYRAEKAPTYIVGRMVGGEFETRLTILKTLKMIHCLFICRIALIVKLGKEKVINIIKKSFATQKLKQSTVPTC